MSRVNRALLVTQWDRQRGLANQLDNLWEVEEEKGLERKEGKEKEEEEEEVVVKKEEEESEESGEEIERGAPSSPEPQARLRGRSAASPAPASYCSTAAATIPFRKRAAPPRAEEKGHHRARR